MPIMYKIWQSNNSFKEIATKVVLIVSSFTVAHSITLALAGLKILSLPVNFVEPTIAFSVALVALNNIIAIYPEKKPIYWLLVLVWCMVLVLPTFSVSWGCQPKD